jgi:hypothetical protein
MSENDFLLSLLGPRKLPKGWANAKLIEFILHSDEHIIDAMAVWPTDLHGRKASGVAQNFRNAAKEAKLIGVDGQHDVLIITERDGKVWLVHRERALAHLNKDEQIEIEDNDESENHNEVLVEA